MPKKKLYQHLVAPFLVIMLAILAVLDVYVARSFRGFYHDHLAADLEARARVLQSEVFDLLARAEYERIDALAKELGRNAGTRFTVILPGGRVVGDSDADPAAMDNHAGRPEIAAALVGHIGRAVRLSPTLHESMMYVGIPIVQEGRILGVLRSALPATAIEHALQGILLRITLAMTAAGVLAVAIVVALSRRIARPLREMQQAAEGFAHGDFNRRVPPQDIEEIGHLADTVNWMAAQLDERMQTIRRQKNELNAMLESMVEGVLAVDGSESILSLNRAAAGLLGVQPAEAAGRTIQEAVRNAELQQFVRRALVSREPVEGDIVLHEDGGLFLQAHGTVLRDAAGRAIGALIVLHDVTELRRLENVRRDFVANVSHELRTPITSIKGFVETLLESAPEDGAKARHFLEIITRQADRLNAIIEDLLSLSRIEREAERGEMSREPRRVREVLEAAVETCRVKAMEHGIEMDLACPPDLEARLNADLVERAVVNLLDNAIKHSERGKRVRVSAEATDGEIAVSVQDEGCGIAREHLPRLFERFYRVDKARSRKLGGTGLGLAIVKHIALAHGGSVSAESEPGKGSTFTIRLPRG